MITEEIDAEVLVVLVEELVDQVVEHLLQMLAVV